MSDKLPADSSQAWRSTTSHVAEQGDDLRFLHAGQQNQAYSRLMASGANDGSAPSSRHAAGPL